MSIPSFKEYFNNLPVFSEEIHKDIQKVLNSEQIPAHHKLSRISSAIRASLKKGEDTGLEDSKPKKGSSRAVYFPKDKTKINLDGKEAHLHTALKVAFPGQLDKYNKSGALLGEHQNNVEGDHYTNQRFGMLHHHGEDEHGVSEYSTNHEHGVLAPMLHAHHEGHHIHFGRIDQIKSGEFRKHTATKEFPKGISHDEMFDSLNHHHQLAHGKQHYGKTSEKRLEEIDDHPFIRKMHDFVSDTGAHPGDLRKPNMGIWTHPHTGEKHIVVSDYGYNGDVAKHYNDARRNETQARMAHFR